MNKKFYLSLLLISNLFASEISMFGAGDLESNTPYGLTSTEKVIVKNKKILGENQKRIKRVDSSISYLSERIDGLESLYDGDGQKLNKLNIKYNKHIDEFKGIQSSIELKNQVVNNNFNKINTNLKQLQLQLNSQKNELDLVKKSFTKIVSLVNEINDKYVTKEEFNRLIKLLDKKSKVTAKSTIKSQNTKKYSKPKKELIDEARVLFKKDYFTKALPILEYLIKQNYRPAECNYYVGEIKYYRKKYKDALFFFKKSMMLYDQAKYLPKLLLHSAISFEKTGQEDNAIKFYNTLVDIYPNTKEAQEASGKIKLSDE